MTSYQILCLLATLALTTSLISSHLHRLQETVAITAFSLCLSLLVLLVGKGLGDDIYAPLVQGLQQLDFDAVLLKGMLGFLLFAGALQIRLKVLRHQKWEILTLSLLSTGISTCVVGGVLYWIAPWLGLPLQLSHCLLFGALISPTDPIAVLAIIKKLGAPEDIAIQVEGESLFNDGIGLVIFVSIFQLAFSTEPLTLADVGSLFLREALGGILYGALLAGALYLLFRLCEDDAQLMLITLSIPTAGYVFAETLGVSGPLAMVSAGILIGNVCIPKYFSHFERLKLGVFWSLIQAFFNDLLFLLLGLILLLVHFDTELWWFVLTAIPLVLFARTVSVLLPYLGFRLFKSYNPYAEGILIWGGLRGGLAIAMAMSLPEGTTLSAASELSVRDLLLVMTYAVVLFSILVQGSTIPGLIKRSNRVMPVAAQARPSPGLKEMS
ncbi:sodium:proton antiporter [Shewanella sp. AS16]|uniref:cation:proton antiporter n=1 Tax=Shewanella sp. AS16 TaxID=2907625 RepID=UPI001F447A68|nr:sodium:proton antiporter [Shewanella sp. AS16]MCE9685306.1 sodium:proton antiporter [Shewanella sp. AS16]